MRKLILLLLLCTFNTVAQEKTPKPSPAVPDLAELKAMAARFAPTRLIVDTSGLSAGDQKALVKLVGAAKIVNTIFMRQFWSGDMDTAYRLWLDTEHKSPLDEARFHYFNINKGPWSEIDEYAAFLPDVPARKPPGANFYPEDMTKEEFETWGKNLYPEH